MSEDHSQDMALSEPLPDLRPDTGWHPGKTREGYSGFFVIESEACSSGRQHAWIEGSGLLRLDDAQRIDPTQPRLTRKDRPNVWRSSQQPKRDAFEVEDSTMMRLGDVKENLASSKLALVGRSGQMSLKELSAALSEEIEAQGGVAAPEDHTAKAARRARAQLAQQLAERQRTHATDRAARLERARSRHRKMRKTATFTGKPPQAGLIFGQGNWVRGLVQVAVVFCWVFGISMALTGMAGQGLGELKLASGEWMIHARAALLFCIGLAGLMLLRGEKLGDLGWMPRPVAFGGALICVAVMGLVTSFIAPFNIEAGYNVETLALLIGIRALGEAVFFQGFVTRTLLIEFKEPAAAIGISALVYGIYALSYAPMLGGSGAQSLYAVLIFTLGGGIPFALMFYTVRSVPALVLFQAIVLSFAAWGGIQAM